MAINFSARVLAPAISVFGSKVLVEPLKSQPGVDPYPARGVISSKEQILQLENGAILADRQISLGIRVSEFDVVPTRGDKCTMVDDGTIYWVAEVLPDGQGGSVLTLRRDITHDT